jgi:hypothetical protein
MIKDFALRGVANFQNDDNNITCLGEIRVQKAGLIFGRGATR